MSRIGNRVIEIPEGVTVTVKDNEITVKGPKGELSTNTINTIEIKVSKEEVVVNRLKDDLHSKAMHGTTNSNIVNMIEGVTKGYEKTLEIIGVGYRFNLQGKKLGVQAGHSHPVEFDIPEGLEVDAKNNTEITVKGIDKIRVGEFAANIRKVREPEPYKGKGIRYKDEYVIRKEGKKAA